MRVLQGTLCGTGHADAQIALVATRPQTWDVACLGLTGEEQLFYLVANEDVEGIGQLVSFSADGLSHHTVRGKIELAGRHPAELAGEVVAERLQQGGRKRFGAADVVFEEA